MYIDVHRCSDLDSIRNLFMGMNTITVNTWEEHVMTIQYPDGRTETIESDTPPEAPEDLPAGTVVYTDMPVDFYCSLSET